MSVDHRQMAEELLIRLNTELICSQIGDEGQQIMSTRALAHATLAAQQPMSPFRLRDEGYVKAKDEFFLKLHDLKTEFDPVIHDKLRVWLSVAFEEGWKAANQ